MINLLHHTDGIVFQIHEGLSLKIARNKEVGIEL